MGNTVKKMKSAIWDMVNRYTFQINGVLEKLTPDNKEEAPFKDIINNIP